jgi:hypothetical protein
VPTLPLAEPMPEAEPEAEFGPVELHAAKANAPAIDTIHLVIVAPVLLPMKKHADMKRHMRTLM